MSLPKVFAIYRRESETFQLLSYDSDDEGHILRLKNWSKPQTLHGIRLGEEDTEAASWIVGTEWYVEPTSEKTEPTVNTVQIHEKEYYWRYLQHDLVWSSYMIYHNRTDMEHGQKAWEQSPKIPILEFNSRQIYPRMDVMGFYPRWASIEPDDIEMELDRARAEFIEYRRSSETGSPYEQTDPKDLRIRTPKPEEDLSISDDDLLAYDHETMFNKVKDRHRTCLTSCVLGVMLTCFLGMYAIIGAQLTGY